MGMLDGDLAAALYNGFKGKLLSGEIVRNVGATSSDLDAHGDPTDVGQDRWEVEGFFDNYSRFTRAQAGIPDSTIKVCVFAQSAPGWTPQKDDLVRLGDRWARLAGGPLEIDPAGALWTLDGEEVEVSE
jgi:hypothetical protein